MMKMKRLVFPLLTLLMAVLLTIDYRQLFGTGWKKGFLLALKTGVYYAFVFGFLIALLIGILLLGITFS